jgi:hypothetical protein
MGPSALARRVCWSHTPSVRQLATPDDLDQEMATYLIRLAVQLSDAPPAAAGLRIDGEVALLLAGPVSAATKHHLQRAIERVGATTVRYRLTSAGLAPLGDRTERSVDLRNPVACAVSGMRGADVAALAEQSGIPMFNAETGAGDPWPLLAEQVAQELAAVRRSRGAVDGLAEMRREALVPTASAAIAVLAGASSAQVGRDDEPAHWFG